MITSTFHQFPLLPTEIRYKIWHLTLQPRTIEIHLKRTYTPDGQPHFMPYDYVTSSSISNSWRPSLPAALHVNAESRAETMPLYRPCNSTFFTIPKGTLINTKINILYCAQRMCEAPRDQVYLPYFQAKYLIGRLAASNEVVPDITILALPLSGFTGFGNEKTMPVSATVEALRKFKSLKKLIFTVDDGNWSNGVRYEFGVYARCGVPELVETQKYQPTDEGRGEMMETWRRACVIKGKLGIAQRDMGEEWIAPEVDLMGVKRVGRQ